MNTYHVIALLDQQRCCSNCKHARPDDDGGYWKCTEGITPDAKGHIYDKDCPDIEQWGICKAHELEDFGKP